jgi:5-oxoprolinase (ATP-hydrolysing)
MECRFEFWIDRGGTFTDVVAKHPDGRLTTAKLLSEHAERYGDAAIAGIRSILGLGESQPIPVDRISVVKMGTTVGTNALLERKGEPTVLFVTRGFRDQLRIAYQNRPRLFDRHIRLPKPLYAKVVEVDERVRADGTVQTSLDDAALSRAFEAVIAEGFNSVAIVFMHAWRYPEHERRAAQLARAAGFDQVSASHLVSPLMKVVARGDTTVVDAYLSPILRRHLNRLERDLVRENVPALYFMKSNGGLSESTNFRGKDCILSGPAGGIVGAVRTALAAGLGDVIGFDMGGTSTDVSHFSGKSLADVERVFDSVVAGVRVRAPMMSIHTIAAGGGSMLHFDGQRLRVGPDSAGANPGPACYGRGGPLTLTDANVLLGRIQSDYFPRAFGPNGDDPIDRDVVVTEFARLAGEISRTTGNAISPEQAAEGFLRVAAANMSNAIKFVSVQRGYDVTQYTLSCFGGAAGQHACLVADELGMNRGYIHPLAGVLSAYGMGLADVTAMREQALEQALDPLTLETMNRVLDELSTYARTEVASQGVAGSRIRVFRRAHLKYEGTDTSLVVQATDLPTMRGAFEAAYRARFAFTLPGRRLIAEAVSVEAVGETGGCGELEPEPARRGPASPCAVARAYFDGAWRDVPVFRRAELSSGQTVAGPAIVAEPNGTTVVDSGWHVAVSARRELLLERHMPRETRHARGASVDPVMLEIFNGLFMSLAERMGAALASTAHSVNIKERLDFSCAVFDGEGNLVSNAPHMPVHLGSMGESVKTVMRKNSGRMRPGDVFALNDPYNGGTHLPDVTAVLPVFAESGDAIPFYVAARGHHADIGGRTPGSMPPDSRSVEEEGVLIDNLKLVESGRFLESELRQHLARGPYPARNPDQNVADLHAQVAACVEGRNELLEMCRRHGPDVVTAYMRHVQANAEECVRRAIGALRDGQFECRMDSGATIRVRISVDHDTRSATVDFSGTSAQLASNFNAPPAVVHAAVLYVFRTLVDDDIPMNAGCMKPITVVIPEESMLSPKAPAATVAGNVETSQCITDALYGALGVLAASQGTMNNFTFGSSRYQYYETVAGGSGAGEGFDGAAAVQTHMTNSRLTDPEVIEWRYPVLVEEHSIRTGSGGAGRFRGGDGALRRVRFLEPMTAAILSNRRLVAPHGLAGGASGEPGATWVERADGAKEALDYADVTEMNPGDVFVIATPGGGGFGR